MQCLSALRICQCAVKVSSSLLPLMLSSPVSAAGSSGDTVVNLLTLWCNVLLQYLVRNLGEVAYTALLILAKEEEWLG